MYNISGNSNQHYQVSDSFKTTAETESGVGAFLVIQVSCLFQVCEPCYLQVVLPACPHLPTSPLTRLSRRVITVIGLVTN